MVRMAAEASTRPHEYRFALLRPSLVGPYRERAENVEAELDAREVAAFKASLARRGRHVSVGVLLTLLAAVGPAVLAVSLAVLYAPPPPLPSGRSSTRCDTHLVWPARGEAFPMTVCR